MNPVAKKAMQKMNAIEEARAAAEGRKKRRKVRKEEERSIRF